MDENKNEPVVDQVLSTKKVSDPNQKVKRDINKKLTQLLIHSSGFNLYKNESILKKMPIVTVGKSFSFTSLSDDIKQLKKINDKLDKLIVSLEVKTE